MADSLTRPTRPAFATLMQWLRATGVDLPDEVTAVASMGQVTVRAGDTVFRQGEHHPWVYAVRQGLCKLCYVSEDGTEWIKSFAAEGQGFACVGTFTPGGVSRFSVTAMEPTVLERVSHATLMQLAQHHHAWALALYQLTLAFAERKQTREHDLLTLDAQARYRKFCSEHAALVPRIPQKDLARHLGLTPVGLNRIAMRVRRLATEASTAPKDAPTKKL